MTTKNSKKGFTLVELVVVIAILAILAAIAIPVVNSIINTAARNSAISNADSIELQIKNCQADIAARNTERYANAVTAPNTISVDDVATKTGIKTAFQTVTYNNEQYIPVWDADDDKCYFIGATGTSVAGQRIDDPTITLTIGAGAGTAHTIVGLADASGNPSTSVMVTTL
jgi:type IV pilus assembly protein PilA